MGYSTDFKGHFTITPPLTAVQTAYLKQWVGSRRMKRSPEIAATLPDPMRIAVGLPLGKDSEYFAGGRGHHGQDHDVAVSDYNHPPCTQPGLWCQWEPSNDGTMLRWDGGEKFYNYVEWLYYMIKNFFSPWGRKLDGQIYWYGEDRSDTGLIEVEDNEVTILKGRLVYGE